MGRTCDIDDCDPNPCDNGGTCTVSFSISFLCSYILHAETFVLCRIVTSTVSVLQDGRDPLAILKIPMSVTQTLVTMEAHALLVSLSIM